MPDFSIIIVSSGGKTDFKPDFPDAEVGQPLGAPQFALVTWDNETGDSHQIAITEETSIDGTRVTVDGYDSGVILPGTSSRQNYIAAAPEGRCPSCAWITEFGTSTVAFTCSAGCERIVALTSTSIFGTV